MVSCKINYLTYSGCLALGNDAVRCRRLRRFRTSVFGTKVGLALGIVSDIADKGAGSPLLLDIVCVAKMQKMHCRGRVHIQVPAINTPL